MKPQITHTNVNVLSYKVLKIDMLGFTEKNVYLLKNASCGKSRKYA